MRRMLISLLVVVMAVAGVLVGESAFAGTCPPGSKYPSYTNTPAECNVPKDEKGKNDAMTIVKNVINVVLGLVGIIAVIMIIFGGFTFITSQGDAAKVAKGRNTLLYGVVGMVIALLAFAIVNFVLSGVFGGGGAKDSSEDDSGDEGALVLPVNETDLV